ncbi:hypothetical protein FP2506_09931 [Fulvimarina pelagi HTCC2506]|uniref:Uncharacterized protein n=1 Tax=Fulvimarina pelagi HTCC2506 TaxID=314231 RepID=Q0G5B0_9HYPH|nr:hypothetical protein FP2506_09931 [Fulvimarina pelagi HTCC2506]
MDFPVEEEHEASRFLEELCTEEKLPLDALSLRTMSAEFSSETAPICWCFH